MSNVVSIFSRGVARPFREVDRMKEESLRKEVIVPAIRSVGLHSKSAENLLVGTASTESDLEVLKQIGGGGALSFWQIEKATYYDCIRYLSRVDNAHLKDKVLASCFVDIFPPFESLTWNLRLACIIARIKYWMQPEKLPAHNDAANLCKYYLEYYNTHLGKATFERSIHYFISACRG